ncbi:hypothetical protein [Nitrosospira briensis]|uniref:hypothetical protein n=1 Tax=Nitrosospira briensis TaxID=35799 RepID=UPI000943240D|nr:hypothetical protein [Nitrosospira briensis]
MSEVPAIEWFANIDNPQTLGAYENAYAASCGLSASINRRIFAPSPDPTFWPDAKTLEVRQL